MTVALTAITITSTQCMQVHCCTTFTHSQSYNKMFICSTSINLIPAKAFLQMSTLHCY